MSGMINELLAASRHHLAMDELDSAELQLKEALAVLEAEKGPDHEDLIGVLETLAGLNWLQMRNEEARGYAARAASGAPSSSIARATMVVRVRTCSQMLVCLEISAKYASSSAS